MNTEIKGHTYAIGKLDAMKQFHVVRRLAPLLADLVGMAGSGKRLEELENLTQENLGEFLAPLSEGLAGMANEDAEFVLHSCLSVVERQQASGGFAKVMSSGRLMFEDIDMPTMLTLAFKVLQENLAGFFGDLPQPDAKDRMSPSKQ